VVPSVRRARLDDSAAIARLHRETISWGLLSQLGERVVTAFYRAVIECPASFCFVADQGGVLQGFAAGVTAWPRLLRYVVARTALPLLGTVPALLASGRWRRLWETTRYTQSGLGGVDAEFLSFGVREQARDRVWAGTALVRAVVQEFRQRGVLRFRGVVWSRNEQAQKFFETVGFRFVSEVEIHPGEVSRAHIVDIGPPAVDIVPGSEGV